MGWALTALVAAIVLFVESIFWDKPLSYVAQAVAFLLCVLVVATSIMRSRAGRKPRPKPKHAYTQPDGYYGYPEDTP